MWVHEYLQDPYLSTRFYSSKFRYISHVLEILENTKNYAIKFAGWTVSDGYRKGVVIGWGEANSHEDAYILLDCMGVGPLFHSGFSWEEIDEWSPPPILHWLPNGTFSAFNKGGPGRITFCFFNGVTSLEAPPSQPLPHRCTACGSPAQLMFNMVNCSSITCRHFRL